MSTDTTARPTQADAQAAMEALGPDALEDTAAPAVAYLQDRLAEHGQEPLWGRDTAMIVAAVALAIRAHIAQPVTARWDQEVIHDADGTATVCCLAEDGQPVALVLDEELTEALAGALLDTEDGEEVEGPAEAAGLRDRIAAAARAHTPSTVDLSRWIAEDVMDVVAPALSARDARIRELEITAERLQHDLDVARAAADPQKIAAVGSLVARTTRFVRIDRDDARARAAALEERLAAVRSVLATWEHRVRYGDSAVAPLLRDLQAVVSDRPATEEARRG
jgi:hypothetical protein